MTWDLYYENYIDWPISLAVQRISKLDDFGTAEQILDVVTVLADDDMDGAKHLLNRAIQYGVKFPGFELSQIYLLLDDDICLKALYQSADTYTIHDLGALCDIVDDEVIIDIANKYNIENPLEEL